MAERRFHYRATVQRVYDGDTVTLDIDLGFDLWLRNQSCRLLGINAPEMTTPAGTVSRDVLRTWLPVGATVYVVTELDRTEKYGRVLVVLYDNARFRPPSLNKRLVTEGLAVVYP